MLTTDQANTIADEALAQQRREHLDSRNRRARRVHWVYQIRGLALRQPFEQAELFVAAQRRVINNALFWACEVAWLCLVASAWYGATPRTVPFILLAGLGAFLGIHLVHVPFMRTELTKLLSAPTSDHSAA